MTEPLELIVDWTPYRCVEQAADTLQTATELLVEGRPIETVVALAQIAEAWKRLADVMAGHTIFAPDTRAG